MAEAALHHDPINGSGKIDIGGEEYDVFALQRGNRLVHLHQVGHHLLQRPLPFAAGARTGAWVWPELTGLLVVRLLRVQEWGPATCKTIHGFKINWNFSQKWSKANKTGSENYITGVMIMDIMIISDSSPS